MRDVLGGKFQSRMAALRGGGGEGLLGGSCISLSAAVSMRPQTRSCSLETILDDSAPLTRQQLFLSSDSLASFAQSSGSQEDSPVTTTPHTHTDFPSVSKAAPVAREIAPGVRTRNRLSVASFGGVSGTQRLRPSRPRSVGSCLDIVVETREEDVKETGKLQDRATSCLDVNTPAHQHHSSSASHPPPLSSYHPVSFFSSSATAKAQGSHLTAAPGGPRPAASTSNLWTLPAPAVVRRCLSSLDVSKQPRPVSLLKPPVRVPTGNSQPAQTKAEQSVLQPHCERVAIEALQLCTLLLPPTSRRKLQLLMRMMSRISQNVDMPRLHPAIGTRTLMVHTFSGCVLGSAEEGDLDELLATRLVSFLMDHQESILSVPEYLRSAINGHIQYLRAVQVPVDGTANADSEDPGCAPVPIYAFCHQISGAEFEQQKLEASQKAMEELLEILLTDQSMSEKDRRKKLKQFQKQYPDIYNRRCPPSERENSKPKIKPPLLNIKKTKAFSIRN